ncbi:hypothetical protein CAEBREN_30530 [Caenorhabditis brenneri]|uniref:Uncharacterized protein n=1 Tax=Caenorhabditis brenneri TaxID=135651 RepID=G0N9F0_CAEBE|nr:hypothetical protein CAEBREN_30530 [Caenorhabditis brenneri]
MSDKIGKRLDEVIQFEFSKPHDDKIRAKLTLQLCSQFLEPLTKDIEKNGKEEDIEEEEEEFKDELNIIGQTDKYLKQEHMRKLFKTRNLECNGVLPFISCQPIPDWQKRDVPIVVSFGFPRIVPKKLLARHRSNKILKIFEQHIHKIFANHEVTDIEHNEAAKVPFLLCTVQGVTVIIKISVKPFRGEQYLAKDVVEKYRK